MAIARGNYIRWFAELGMADVPLVGGKNASLGEMFCELTAQGVRVPNGFAITAQAYRHVLDRAEAWPALHEALDGLNSSDLDDLARRAQKAREIVYGAKLPDDLVAQIKDAYARLRAEYGEDMTVAVRSSATAEDLPSASFAGQHESFLNVSGEARLLDAVRQCFASLFTDRAISYRIDNGFDHFQVLLSVGVMKMVRSDMACSGVIFSLDTESGFRDVVFITGAYGLGETVVQGTVDPDEEFKLGATGKVCASGRAVGARVASGKARVITDITQLGQFQAGEVLVADTTMPDWGTVMKSAAALVTNRGGRTCHAAIVARELGIPAVVGCETATTSIKTGDAVTVSCAEGSVGRVYAGVIPVQVTRTDLSTLARPRTRLMVNLGNPEVAFQTSFLPNDGVGLARLEFIVAEYIKVHPMALLQAQRITDPAVRAQIERLTEGYARPADFFVRELAEGVAIESPRRSTRNP